jgi:nitrite reductase/ring-hydroxylating ferredoxin subunit
MADLNRREFVTAAAVTCAACAACACVSETALGEDTPSSPPAGGSGGQRGPLPKTPFDIGPKSDYAKDGVVDKFAKTERILVVTHEGKIYCPTATCTHKNAVVSIKTTDPGKGDLFCRAHGSKFSLEGTVTKGPAKISLARYAISVNDKGNIIVDRSKQFEEKQWDDPKASISVG